MGIGLVPAFTASTAAQYVANLGRFTAHEIVPVTGKMAFPPGMVGGNSVHYGPINPGPLDNAVAATFRGGSYTSVTTTEVITLYRVYGGSVGKIGSYWTKTPPNGPLQSQLDSALAPQWGNTAQNTISIQVPKGITIYEGAAAPQSTGVGQLMGGGSQVYIPRVDPKWIKQEK